MREILFRGKTYDGRLVEGCLICAPNYTCILEAEEKVHPMDYPYLDGELGTFDGKATPVIPETVGQYTGLTDKNGTKIFEGDIVEFSTTDYCGGKYHGEVVFRNGCYGIEYVLYGETKLFHRIGEIGRWQDMGASGTITYKYQKIGNIHDNPEMLGGGEDA